MHQVFVSKLIHILIAVLFLCASIVLALSALSYSKSDPSIWNITSNKNTENVFGDVGANISDVGIQTIGYSIYLIAFVFFIFCIKFFLYRKPSFFFIRISFLIPFIILFSCGISYFDNKRSEGRVGYGGFIGDYIADYLVYADIKPLLQFVIPIMLLPFIIFVLGITKKELMAITKLLLYTSRGILKFLCVGIKLIIKFFTFVFKSASLLIMNARNRDDYKSEGENLKIQTIENTKRHSKKKNEKALSNAVGFYNPKTALLDKIQNDSSNHKSIDISEELLQVLSDFGIKGKICSVNIGPVVTLYNFEPVAGTKSSRVIGLSDDIARSLKAISVRIAIVPGQSFIGIELPNMKRDIISLRELLECSNYQNSNAKLPLVLGKGIGGSSVIADLSKMPHLLVAGTTGSGKSVAINAMILSILYKRSPLECRFVMIDPKMLELSIYDGIAHLLTPVVTDPKKAVNALKWTVKEMEERYKAMSMLGVRNIESYNQIIENSSSEGISKKVQIGFDDKTGKPIFKKLVISNEKLPYIVVVVDEMADLMLTSGKEIEGYIQRLAQMARAAGIHIIIATQRPSVDVITGVIKANFPTRISFQVTSKIDSRTILGEQGAEQLLGMGDMLYMKSGGKIDRVHGPFVKDADVEKVVAFIKQQGPPDYIDEIIKDSDENGGNKDLISGDLPSAENEDLYNMAIEIVIRDQRASTSYIQRCLKIGYNRAATIIERMEKDGIVSSANHVGKREVLKQ
ncbi:MAG: DNA translocase FtsK 4TM domain-containing protein [Proteobacteria bacterium]|nr:DNA translocase FtsK 4TM domain-containing protein [Pseudomonadota bacterium]